MRHVERVFLQDFEQVLKLHEAYIQEKRAIEQAQDGAGGVVSKFTTELNCDRLIAVGLVNAKRSTLYNGGMNIEGADNFYWYYVKLFHLL